MSLFNPENFVEGGGLLDDVDVTFEEVRVEMFDYNGKSPTPSPALRANLKTDDGEVHTQYWSMGKATDWQPNEDGTSIVAVGKATGIAKSSNLGLLLISMVNAGFPTNKITDDVRCFEGLRAHMTRVPAPKRNVAKAPREDGRVFDDTILTVGSILPPLKGAPAPKGKPPVAGGAPAAAPAAKPTAPASTDDDITTKATEVMMEILAESPEGLKKAQIPTKAMPKVKDLPEKNKIITLIFKDDFLANGPWTYEGGVVTL